MTATNYTKATTNATGLGEVSASDSFRLLESGDFRLLENGTTKRVLESGQINANNFTKGTTNATNFS